MNISPLLYFAGFAIGWMCGLVWGIHRGEKLTEDRCMALLRKWNGVEK